MNLHDWTSVVFVQTAIITLNRIQQKS